MSYGLQTFNQNGVEVFNATTGLTLLDAFTLLYNTGGGSKAYQDANGLILSVQRCYTGPAIGNPHNVYIDYSAGYPTIYWVTPSSSPIGSNIYVFAK